MRKDLRITIGVSVLGFFSGLTLYDLVTTLPHPKKKKKKTKMRNGFPFLSEYNDGVFRYWMNYKDGFSWKVKFRERKSERPFALGRGGELGGFGVDF